MTNKEAIADLEKIIKLKFSPASVPISMRMAIQALEVIPYGISDHSRTTRAEEDCMKVSALTRLMNDRGTKPRIKVMKYMGDSSLLVYEGHPENAGDEIKTLKVNSFTVLGTGFLEIFAQ